MDKQLMEKYLEGMAIVWNGNAKMIAYEKRNVGTLFEFGGKIYMIEKPKIETRFCFGYGMNGISDEEDENRAERMSEYARESQEYFKSENMKDIERMIKQLKEIKGKMGLNWAIGSCPRYIVSYIKKYTGDMPDYIGGWCIEDTYGYCTTEQWQKYAGIDFIDALLKAYEEVKSDFEKRIDSYLKRYGLSKVNSWSYLVD